LTREVGIFNSLSVSEDAGSSSKLTTVTVATHSRRYIQTCRQFYRLYSDANAVVKCNQQ